MSTAMVLMIYLVGASGAAPNGNWSGAGYVIFGGQGVLASAVVGDEMANTLTGDGMANQLIGGAGDDTLIGNGGADVLRGGAGDDVLALGNNLGDNMFAVINGGLGNDTLRLDSTMTLDLTSIPNNHLESIEVIDLNGTASTLVLATDDILSIVGSVAQNTLRIDGSSTDTLDLGKTAFFNSGDTEIIGSTDYRIYRPTASLELDDSVGLLIAPEVRVENALPFPVFPIPAVELSAIQMNDNNDGFVLNGASEGDYSGRSVSRAGDVNGDGLDDLIIGAPNGNNNSGTSYVVFGKRDGNSIELSDIAGDDNNNGFVMNGIAGNNHSGLSVSSAGDVNGDGLDDLIIGAPHADPNGNNNSGASYVVFGKSDGGVVQLSTIADANENDNAGFVLSGASEGDLSGRSVSGAGDINGDGLDDILIGAHHVGPNGSNNGASYVVFGKSDGGVVQLSTIADANENDNAGFVLSGASEGDLSGRSVSGAGDVNGDELDDIIIGAFRANPNGNNSGASYVVFGRTSGDSVALSEVADGDTDEGFVINGGFFPTGLTGDLSGRSVSGAGDVNGDGLDDIIIGAVRADPNGNNSGASYVVFGKTGNDIVELSAIADDADDAGFIIKGIDAGDRSGISVSGAGDINGDGLDDLIIGARDADPNGDRSGASYLIFGKSDGNAVELSLIEFGFGGFVINGASGGDHSGISVSAAGDVNGDGFDDLLVGASGADPNGNASGGASYVIFGGEVAETLTGNSRANRLIGGGR